MISDLYCPECGSFDDQELMEILECLDHNELIYYCHDCGEEYTILEMTKKMEE